jgi:FixJ family two-component response regulator
MLRVGIVDDDTSHCRALARLLRASGMETLTFASAEEFLERRNGSVIDCLVLDIQLGGMSGFELQSRLAATGLAPPVVFLTAHEDPETIARAARTGCAYVKKTEPGPVLLEAIRRAVADHPQSGGTP